MKARNPSTGTLETVYVKALDSMPVGSVVDFTGSSADVPAGWEEVYDYSTTEIDTGKKWIDGKPIYRKVVDTGALPNTTSKTVAHGITNLDFIVNLYGVAKSSTSFMKLNTVRPESLPSAIGMWIDGSNIKIMVQADRTAFTSSYTIIEYTKTTD